MQVLRDIYAAIVGAEHVSETSPLKSATDRNWHRPTLVVRPRTSEEVKKVIEQASRDRLTVIPGGGHTGYSGGTTSPEGGIVVDTRRMTDIIEVDQKRRWVRVQPGITVNDLNEKLKPLGYWWPHNPGSRAMATVGGVISVAGIGTFHSRYGSAPHMVLGLTVVTASGEVITLGPRPLTRATGYDILRLFLTSEGTLGVITEVTLRIWKLPAHREIRILGFGSIQSVEAYTLALLHSGITPEVFLVESADRFVTEFEPVETTPEELSQAVGNAKWCVIVATAGDEEPTVWQADYVVREAVKHEGRPVGGPSLARDYWRRKVEKPITDRTPIPDYHVVDVAMPGLEMGVIEQAYARMVSLYDVRPKGLRFYVTWPQGEVITSAQIFYDENDEHATRRAAEWNRALSLELTEAGGTLSAILGVGMRLTGELAHERSAAELRIMKALKAVVDPEGIMNKGKLLQ